MKIKLKLAREHRIQKNRISTSIEFEKLLFQKKKKNPQ